MVGSIYDSRRKIWLKRQGRVSVFHLYSANRNGTAECGIARPEEVTENPNPKIYERCRSCEKLRQGHPRNSKIALR